MSTATALPNPQGMFRRIGWDDHSDRTSRSCMPIVFGTETYDPSDDDRCIRPDTKTWSVVYIRGVEAESETSATASKVEDAQADNTFETSDLDLALSMVREFEGLEVGWDEPNSPVPTEDLIEDALVVLQNWPVSGHVPEPSVGTDGHIALELYDDDGFVLGGVEVTGERNAIFSIVQRAEVLCTGRFATTSQTEMIKALSNFKHHLG